AEAHPEVDPYALGLLDLGMVVEQADQRDDHAVHREQTADHQPDVEEPRGLLGFGVLRHDCSPTYQIGMYRPRAITTAITPSTTGLRRQAVDCARMTSPLGVLLPRPYTSPRSSSSGFAGVNMVTISATTTATTNARPAPQKLSSRSEPNLKTSAR